MSERGNFCVMLRYASQEAIKNEDAPINSEVMPYPIVELPGFPFLICETYITEDEARRLAPIRLAEAIAESTPQAKALKRLNDEFEENTEWLRKQLEWQISALEQKHKADQDALKVQYESKKTEITGDS